MAQPHPRILLVSNNFAPNVGGVETHLDDLVKELTDRSMAVFVLTYKPLTTKARSKMIERHENLTILRIPWLRGPFYKSLSNPVFAFVYLVPGLIVALPLVLLTRKFDLVHAHGIAAAFAAATWSKIFHNRLVVTLHARYGFPGNGAFYSVANFIFSRADAILCLSEQSVNDVLKLGVPVSKVSRFTNWIDLEKFQPIPKVEARKSLNWAPDEFIVLFVGRLVSEKGIPELLEATRHLDNNISVVIAGDGPLQEDVRAAAEQYPVTPVGKIKNAELATYFSAADVFINPPRHEESFARVILEALACGTPVIGPNKGEVVEILDESVSIQIDTAAGSISQAINELAADPKRAKRLASSARDFAVLHYSNTHMKAILNSYSLRTHH